MTFSLESSKAAYAKYLLGDAKKVAPFYWAEWNNGKLKKVSCTSQCLCLPQSVI